MAGFFLRVVRLHIGIGVLHPYRHMAGRNFSGPSSFSVHALHPLGQRNSAHGPAPGKRAQQIIRLFQ
jgi:hypothetical protein